jgi:thiol-disulfide isomerase/thioredoxin
MKRTSNKSRKKNKFFYFSVILILITVGITGIYLISNNENSGNNNIEYENNFTFYDLNGFEKQLIDYKGKIVILDMWATWCQPCQYQMLELEKAYNFYSKDNLEILSINIDSGETVSEIEDFIETFSSYGYHLDWVFGREMDSLERFMPSGSIPTLCIFDENGKLAFSHTGLMPFSEIPNGWPDDTELLKEKLGELIE